MSKIVSCKLPTALASNAKKLQNGHYPDMEELYKFVGDMQTKTTLADLNSPNQPASIRECTGGCVAVLSRHATESIHIKFMAKLNGSKSKNFISTQSNFKPCLINMHVF
jgi:hypothetical protein